MMSSKDRRIANQKVMIQNRDKLIKHQEDKIAKLEAVIRQIRTIASSNRYGNAEAYLRKINELIRRLNQYQFKINVI